MFFVKLYTILFCSVSLVLVLAQASCETSNSNPLSCFEDDCQVYCETKGFEGGSCDGQICECQSAENPTYQWIEDTDSESDTESDGGSS